MCSIQEAKIQILSIFCFIRKRHIYTHFHLIQLSKKLDSSKRNKNNKRLTNKIGKGKLPFYFSKNLHLKIILYIPLSIVQ